MSWCEFHRICATAVRFGVYDEVNRSCETDLWNTIAIVIGNAYWAECGTYPKPNKCKETIEEAIEAYLAVDDEDTTTGGGELSIDDEYNTALDSLSKEYAKRFETKAK